MTARAGVVRMAPMRKGGAVCYPHSDDKGARPTGPNLQGGERKLRQVEAHHRFLNLHNPAATQTSLAEKAFAISQHLTPSIYSNHNERSLEPQLT